MANDNFKQIYEGIKKLEIQQIFDFDTKDQAYKLLDWLTNNGFDAYGDIEPVQQKNKKWAIMLAQEYKHRADEVQAQTVKIRSRK
jgi:hypothetical protein